MFLFFVIVFVLIAVILISKIKIAIAYDEEWNIHVIFWGIKIDLLALQKKAKAKKTKNTHSTKKETKVKESEKSEPKSMKETIEQYFGLAKELLTPIKKVLIRLKKDLIVEYFNVDVTFSTGDPSRTGVVYGTICATIQQTIDLLDEIFNIRKKSIWVTPIFEGEMFLGKFSVAFSMKMLDIVIITVMIIKNCGYTYFKEKEKMKKTKKKCKTI